MALYDGLLNETCSVYRLGGYAGTHDYTSSDFGEVDELWTIMYSSVPCRKNMSSTGTLRLTGGMIEAGGTTVFVKSTADIVDGDRLVIAGEFWAVEDAVQVNGMNTLHHKEIRVRKIDWSS